MGKKQRREGAKGEERCQCLREHWGVFQKKQPVWPVPPVRKEPWQCVCAMHWVHGLKMSTVSLCTRWKVTQPTNPGDEPS